MKEERTVTQVQVLDLCPKVKKHLDNALTLLDREDRHYDSEALALCLGMAVTELSKGLGWHGGTFKADTHIGREALIQALVPARGKVGAAETLAREHYLQVDSEEIWKMLATALISLQQVLASTTFKGKAFVFSTIGTPKSTNVF